MVQAATCCPTSPAASPVWQPDEQTPPPRYAGPNAPHLPTYGGQITNFDYSSYMAQANHQAQTSHQRTLSAGLGLPSLMEMSSPVSPPPRGSAMRLPLGPLSPEKEVAEHQTDGDCWPTVTPGPASTSFQPVTYASFGRNHNPTNRIDTQTPVVVLDSESHHHHALALSGGGTIARDNVLPGELMIFDG
jgi:hypothetical protein